MGLTLLAVSLVSQGPVLPLQPENAALLHHLLHGGQHVLQLTLIPGWGVLFSAPEGLGQRELQGPEGLPATVVGSLTAHRAG